MEDSKKLDYAHRVNIGVYVPRFFEVLERIELIEQETLKSESKKPMDYQYKSEIKLNL